MPDYFAHTLNSKARYGVDWDALGWLPEGAQITASTFTPTPSTGITITGQAIADSGTETSAMIEVTETGVYRVRNHVNANDGSYGDWDLILSVADPAEVFGYLTLSDAEMRLFTYWQISDAALTGGDIATASDEIDALGPFIGTRRGGAAQLREFPRSVTPAGTQEGEAVPDAILNAVARLAYHIAEDADPAVTGESQLDRSVTYANPKPAPDVAAVYALVRPYLRKSGGKASLGLTGYKHPDDVGWPVAFENY